MTAPAGSGQGPARPVIGNVQSLRLLAATGVVLSHVADRLIPHDPAHRWFWAVPWTGGVDLFFVISGFIMFRLSHDRFGEPGAAAEFLARRIVRIVPPYWFVTTATVAVVIVAGGRLQGTAVDPMQLVTSYGFFPWPRTDGSMVPIVGQGWTLNYEMFFYACFALALLHRRGARGLVAAFLLLALLHPLLPAELSAAAFWSDPIILEFLGGMGIARVHLSGYRLTRATALAVAIGGAAWCAATIGVRGEAARVVHVGIPALLLACGAVLVRERRRRGTLRRLIERGGDATYALYLVHYIVINAVALAWVRLGAGSPWAGVALGVACSGAAAALFHRAVERPMVRWLQRRLARSAPRPAPGPSPAADPL